MTVYAVDDDISCSNLRGHILFFEVPGELPAWAILDIMDARASKLVCRCSDVEGYGKNQPMKLWQFLHPRNLFKNTTEKTDIVCDSNGRLYYFYKRPCLRTLPIWLLEECLSHWEQLMASDRWAYQKQFLPHIKAFIDEKKGTKP